VRRRLSFVRLQTNLLSTMSSERSSARKTAADTLLAKTDLDMAAHQKLATLGSDDTQHSARMHARSEVFKLGMKFSHGRFGLGVVTHAPGKHGGNVKMQFGQVNHTFKPHQLDQLVPFMEDAHKFTAETLFKMVDTDSSGVLNLDEFKKLHEIITKDEQVRSERIHKLNESTKQAEERQRRLKVAVVGAILFVLFLLACMGGLMVAVIAGYKDTEAAGSMLASPDGLVLQTAPALSALPMLAAPVLASAQLHKVQRLAISYGDPKLNNAKVNVMSNVNEVFHVNSTAIKFLMAKGPVSTVYVWNGEAYAILTDTGDKVAICENDVECSALMVEDAESVSSLLQKAKTALEAAGFDASSIEADAERRRLEDTGSNCDLASATVTEEPTCLPECTASAAANPFQLDNPTSWDLKCRMHECSGCARCSICKPMCASSAGVEWNKKCGWNDCVGCSDTEEEHEDIAAGETFTVTELRCDHYRHKMFWCSARSEEWGIKCEWDSCSGYEQCNAPEVPVAHAPPLSPRPSPPQPSSPPPLAPSRGRHPAALPDDTPPEPSPLG